MLMTTSFSTKLVTEHKDTESAVVNDWTCECVSCFMRTEADALFPFYGPNWLQHVVRMED